MTVDQLARPDAPGIWSFTGSVITRQGEVDEMTLVLEKLTLHVVEKEGALVIIDPDSETPLGGAWVGKWEPLR